MTGLISSILARKRKQPAPEEIEALNRANLVLQWRVERMTAEAPAVTPDSKAA